MEGLLTGGNRLLAASHAKDCRSLNLHVMLAAWCGQRAAHTLRSMLRGPLEACVLEVTSNSVCGGLSLRPVPGLVHGASAKPDSAPSFVGSRAVELFCLWTVHSPRSRRPKELRPQHFTCAQS